MSVALQAVRESNNLLRTYTPGLVAVFVGGTSGVGESTLKALAAHATKPTIYIVGRNETAATKIIEEATRLNPEGIYRFIQADLTLLKTVDTVCEEIKQKENKVDILFTSTGQLNFDGRQETTEGLDKILSLRYYSRLRFITNLLPQLAESSLSRVVSINAAGKEGPLIEDDLELVKNYSFINCMSHSSTMTSCAFEQLAIENPKTSFVHVYPGVVKTNIYQTFSGVIGFLVNWILLPLMTPFALSVPESGERNLFIATSARYPSSSSSGDSSTAKGVPLVGGIHIAKGADGQVGSGAYLLDWDGKEVGNKKVLDGYRQRGYGKTVWEQTLAVLNRVGRN